jgi:hypothetical protein
VPGDEIEKNAPSADSAPVSNPNYKFKSPEFSGLSSYFFSYPYRDIILCKKCQYLSGQLL